MPRPRLPRTFSIARLALSLAVLGVSLAWVRGLAGFDRREDGVGTALLRIDAPAGCPDLMREDLTPRDLEVHAERVLSPAVLDEALATLRSRPRTQGLTGLVASPGARERLRRRLRASVVPDTHIVQVVAKADSDAEARSLADAVAEAYEEIEGPATAIKATVCYPAPSKPSLDRPWVWLALTGGLLGSAGVLLAPREVVRRLFSDEEFRQDL